MRQLYDKVSFDMSRNITNTYSTSFSLAVKMLAPSIRAHVYNIYGFVRLADEIVDSFHDQDKEDLLNDLERDLWKSLEQGISINPVLNAFQDTVRRFNIDHDLIIAFMSSMRMDLIKNTYVHREEYETYIYGSADVVGLMCLKVFVKGNQEMYNQLKAPAMKLGSAFQKVNFLRDFKADMEELNRSYFPELSNQRMNKVTKAQIIADIESDFEEAYKGILDLPAEARFGVYTAYRYYRKLLIKLSKAPADRLIEKRVRVGNHVKLGILAKSFVRFRLNIL